MRAFHWIYPRIPFVYTRPFGKLNENSIVAIQTVRWTFALPASGKGCTQWSDLMDKLNFYRNGMGVRKVKTSAAKRWRGCCGKPNKAFCKAHHDMTVLAEFGWSACNMESNSSSYGNSVRSAGWEPLRGWFPDGCSDQRERFFMRKGNRC